MWSTYNNTTLLPGRDCLLLATQMLLCVTETFSDSFYHLGQVNRDDVKICFPTHTFGCQRFFLSHPLVQGHCARLSALLLMVAAGVHGSDGSDGSLSRVA